MNQELNLSFETTFTVLPKHCNHMYPMIFGGAFFSELDLCAAACARRLLQASECDSAVTYKVLNLIFHKAAQSGDIIFMQAEVVELRKKAITIQVSADREHGAMPGRDHVADATFVFVSKKGHEYVPHGLSIPGS